MITVICRVCAEFHDRHGIIVFQVRAQDLGKVIEAPEAIREDPLFKMLKDEGSLDVPGSKQEMKEIEDDPMKDHGADGRKTASVKAPAKTSGREARQKKTIVQKYKTPAQVAQALNEQEALDAADEETPKAEIPKDGVSENQNTKVPEDDVPENQNVEIPKDDMPENQNTKDPEDVPEDAGDDAPAQDDDAE